MADNSDNEWDSSTSSSSSSFEGSFDSELSGVQEVFQGIQPWRFEPPGRNNESASDDDAGEQDPVRPNRLENSEW